MDSNSGNLSARYGHMTAEEYFRTPEGPPYLQLVDGELVWNLTPDFYHQQIVGRLIFGFYQYLEENPVRVAIMAPSDVQFDTFNVYQPDLYFVSKSRLAIIDEQGPKGAPDLVIEILSPNTRRLDLGRKKELYSTSGVLEYWVITPEARELQVYYFQEGIHERAATLKMGDTLKSPVLPGFSLPMADIFPPLPT